VLRLFEKRLRGYRAMGYARGGAPVRYEEPRSAEQAPLSFCRTRGSDRALTIHRADSRIRSAELGAINLPSLDTLFPAPEGST
jgi:hypothetical protein